MLCATPPSELLLLGNEKAEPDFTSLPGDEVRHSSPGRPPKAGQKIREGIRYVPVYVFCLLTPPEISVRHISHSASCFKLWLRGLIHIMVQGRCTHSRKEHRAGRYVARHLENLTIDDVDASGAQENTAVIAPPARRGSKSGRTGRASGARKDTTVMVAPARRGAKSSHARKAPASTTTANPPLPNLPPGVTPTMIEANLRRIQQAPEAAPPPPQHSASALRPQAQPTPQVGIDSDTLPVGLSVFCNRLLFTREITFNLKRLDSLKTIKTIVNTYFAYEFKRIGLPREVYFAGLHCVYHRSSKPEDVVTYGSFVTDYEYQLAHAEVADSKTTTGQMLRLQVALYTDQQLADDQEMLKDWFADGEYDAMREVNGLEWLLNCTDTDNPYNDTRMFETDRDDSQVVTIPAHLYREMVEKARLGEAYRDNYSNVVAAKAKIRNKEYDIRKDLIKEARGLRRLMRELGVTEIDMDDVAQAARDAEGTERRGRVDFEGETQDFRRMKELRQQVEDKSDKANAEEGGAFDRAFLNI